MKSDTITTSERRRIVRSPPRAARRGPWPARGRASARAAARRPGAGPRACRTRPGSSAGPRRRTTIAPIRLPRRVRTRASVVTKSTSTVRLSRPSPHGPEVDRRAEVEQEPGRDLAVLVVLADVRHGRARGDVPVDRADVVAGLVLAQPGEVHAGTPEQRCGTRPGAGRPAAGRPASRGAGGRAQARTADDGMALGGGRWAAGRAGGSWPGSGRRRCPSDSASYERTSRWRMTSAAMSSTSSGRTYSRPRRKASARPVRMRLIDARGLAPYVM